MSIIVGAFEVGEISGATVLSDGTLLIVSDEEGVFTVEDGARRVAKKRVEKKHIEKVEYKGIDTLDDIEDVSFDAKSDSVFLVTSHSRNKRGQTTKKRYKIARLTFKKGKAELEHDDWLLWEILERQPQLATSILRTPAQGGFNIEGVVYTLDGDLLLGLRSPTSTPVPRYDEQDEVVGKDEDFPEAAQLLRIEHARNIWTSDPPKGKEARLSRELIHLDLDGQGIRGLCRDEENGYWVLSSLSVDPNHQAMSTWKLWHWDGNARQSPRLVAVPDEIRAAIKTPEAICVLEMDKVPHLLFIEDREGESPYALMAVSDLKEAANETSK
jgi:hypothetical protein